MTREEFLKKVKELPHKKIDPMWTSDIIVALEPLAPDFWATKKAQRVIVETENGEMLWGYWK